MKKCSSFLSILLSFVLCLSMVPNLAFGEESDSSQAERIDNVSSEETEETISSNIAEELALVDAAPQSISDEEDDSQSVLQQATTVATPLDLSAVKYVYVDVLELARNEDQNIVVGFTDEGMDLSSAKLIFKDETGTSFEVSNTNIVPGAVLFSFNANEYAVAQYQITLLEYVVNGSDGGQKYSIDFEADTVTYAFKVTGSADNESAVEQEGVTAFTIDENGDLTEEESIEKAVRAAQAMAPSMYDVRSRAKDLVVVLDPGHGGTESGATSGYGIIEKDTNLKIAQYCKEELEQYSGVRVVMTRANDATLSLDARVNIAKREGARVFVSIHCNSATSSGPNGSEVYYPRGDIAFNPNTSTEGKALAQKILNNLTALGLNNRGINFRPTENNSHYSDGSPSDYYGVIYRCREAGIPGLIVEHAFVSNPSDASKLKDPAFLRELGIADAKGIAAQYGLTKLSWEKASAFVTRLYEEVLDRTPDAVGLNAHTSALINGAAAAPLAASFFSSSEFKNRRLTNEQKVDVAYLALLNREADSAGKNNYLNRLSIGMSEMAIVADLCNSSEFKSLCRNWGLTPGYYVSPENRDKNYNVTAFVSRLYQKVLSRSADVSGLNAHAGALLAGTTGADVAWGFFGSREFANLRLPNAEQVERAYQVFLDRASDPKGKAEWTSKLDAGMSIRTIVAGFSGSPEFRNLCSRWGIRSGSLSVVENRDKNYNVTAFVSRLYQKVLNRSADVSGLNAHAGALLAGTAGADVAWGFFGSREFANLRLPNAEQVERAYQVFLDRASDPKGKAEWTSKLDAGMSIRTIVAGFSGSPEFRNLCSRWGIRSGSLSVVENRDKNYNVTAFVSRLYQKVLSRSADVSGLNSHTGSLLSGTQAASLAWSFFDSPEFSRRGLTNEQKIEIVYQTMLNRASDPGGKASWLEKLNNGLPLKLFVAGFTNSSEFQDLCRGYGLNAGTLPYDAYTVDRYSGYPITGTAPSSIISKMIKYYQKSGATYPATDKYKASDAPNIDSFCRIVYNEATAEGVKPEVVFCQAMKETGWLRYGGVVDVDQFNFAGLGATSSEVSGATFNSVAEGIRAQVQHLKCYASTAPLNNPCVDPRWNNVVQKYGRGCAPTLEALNGKWAIPGDGYGQSIRSMIDRMVKL